MATTLKGLADRRAYLVEKQAVLVEDKTRPWSQKKAEYYDIEADVKILNDNINQLKSVSGSGGDGYDSAFLEGLGSSTPSFSSRIRGRGTSVTPNVAKAAKSVQEHIVRANGGTSTKAINSGSIDLSGAPIVPIQSMGEFPTRVLDLLPALNRDRDNVVEYLRQVTRTQNAEFVPDLGEKPESVYTLQAIEERFRVLAHLSEPFPQRYLSDIDNLQPFLAMEMVAGVRERLNDAILNGDDDNVSTDEFDGLIKLAGTPQAFNGDVVSTLSDTVDTLEAAGQVPNGIVMNPADRADLRLEREGAGGMYLYGPPVSAAAREAFGLPIVAEPAMPAGSALVGDFTHAPIVWREGERLDIDTSGELFKTNAVQLRLEARVVLMVTRIPAFKLADLTA